jgi:XTP/dITP diphosphohydrolase
MRKLFIATKNTGKLKEIKHSLKGLDIEFLSLSDTPGITEPLEDGTTFEENAVKKAKHVYEQIKIITLADDSGLEVEYLNGKPGIYSARYAGENATDEQNRIKLLNEMKDAADSQRKAKFTCVLAIYNGIIHNKTFTGICEGKIISEMRGDKGFGYDPLFIPEGYYSTFAELDLDVKNKISHRGKALAELRKYFIKAIN